jgi:prevent-host-death family protein
MDISIAEIHNRLSHWIKQARREPLVITNRGKPVGVLISPEEYEKLRQVQAYLEMVRLSRAIRESGVTAQDLYQVSRQELEDGR